jgi:Pyruvate/2-oxoacid:ferredoxin oxidoreductase delta subunit
MPIIRIDYDLCTSCDVCVDQCTIRLLVSEDGLAKPRGDRVEDTRRTRGTVEYDAPGCSACRICEISCPVEAIVIEV